MFKFDFAVQEEPDNPFVESNEDESENLRPTESIQWYDAREILSSKDLLDNIDLYRLNSTNMAVGGTTITHIISGYLLKDINAHDMPTKDIQKAEESHSDLIPGVYEGGAKVWECTVDLLIYLSEQQPSQAWSDKRILDLGCGSGLLGIFAYKCGARAVNFQDYNEDVLEHITMPNLLLNSALPPNATDFNLDKLHDEVRFYSGDWSKYVELTASVKDEQKFDLILTSETIYNPENQQKLLDTLHAQLKCDGIVFVAAKTYYFGVGGGLRQFENLVEKDQRFKSEVVWTATEGVGREILKLTRCSET